MTDTLNLFNDRYARQRLINWWDQDKLANARVIVAGAGALGNEVIKLLALMGFGYIQVVDFDTVSASNLARMVLFRESDIGRPKALAAAERLSELNPAVKVQPVQGDLRFDVGLGDYRRAAIVFGCLDSVNARWALNRRCLLAGVEWIDGGISDFHGQVSRYSPRAGTCYECTFTEATYERFSRRYSCPYGLAMRNADRAVPTTAVTTSIIAALQVEEALLALHGQDERRLQPGQRLSVYMAPYRMLVDDLPANPDCLAHHSLPESIPCMELPGTATIEDAIHGAQVHLPSVDTLELGFDLVTEFRCAFCGEVQPVMKPKETVFQDQLACPECGHTRTPEIVSSVNLGTPLASQSLSSLRLPEHEILAFSNETERTYLEI